MVRTVSLLVLVIVVVVAKQEVEDVSSHRIRSLPEVMSATRGNWTSLSEALDIFSVSNLVKNWAEGKYPVASQCQKDISRFVQGIRNKELWAIKGKIFWRPSRAESWAEISRFFQRSDTYDTSSMVTQNLQ